MLTILTITFGFLLSHMFYLLVDFFFPCFYYAGLTFSDKREMVISRQLEKEYGPTTFSGYTSSDKNDTIDRSWWGL